MLDSDSCPESSDSLSSELELLDESLLESLACPELDLTSTLSEKVQDQNYSRTQSSIPAISARSGSYFLRALYHFLDSFGLPLTVLCHTMGKLVLDEKLCVTAMVVSIFRTTCHRPPGTNMVSPE